MPVTWHSEMSKTLRTGKWSVMVRDQGKEERWQLHTILAGQNSGLYTKKGEFMYTLQFLKKLFT